MHRPHHLIAFYLGAVFFLAACLFLPQSTQAQTLNNVSVATRSNGTGYVVRLHMNKAPKGFDLRQPHPHGLEILLNDPKASLSKLKTGNVEFPIQHMRKVAAKNGEGLVLELDPGHYYTTEIYRDANKRDILIALTSVSREEAETFALKQKGLGWVEPLTAIPVAPVSTVSPSSGSTTTPGASSESRTQMVTAEEASALYEFDETYRRLRNNVRFDVVVIDAGHGGHDPGAVGLGKTREKDVVLKTALKLGALIEERMPDVKVVYTRKDDTFISLENRGKIANKAQGDLFISIHCNAARNRSAYGAEVFFMGQHRTEDALEVMLRENSVIDLEASTSKSTSMSPEQLLAFELANIGNISSSEKMAAFAIDEFKSYAKRPSRGVKQAGFWVLYHASMPAVLVELGFLSNREEEAYLKTDAAHTELAEAMFRAVVSYRDQYERSLNFVPVQRVSN